jgi:pyruvate dehydrogenase E2 component (dihydrolipoamide acetyltransferase)
LWSKQNVPHYYLTVDIRVDALQQLRTSWSKDNNISLHACLIKAAAMSMKTVPAVNASYLGDVVRTYHNVDLQVVGDDENMVVKDCANLGLAAIERIVSSKTDDTKGGADVMGTFSFCNLGMYGIASCAPIIRPPQACALAVGAVETVLVPSDDKDIPYQSVLVLTATLSCDHRVVDGAVGAQWLATFKNYVEHPTTLLL